MWHLPVGSSTWLGTSWHEFADVARKIGAAMHHLGLLPGETVGIIAPSSPRWESVQIGALAAGGVVVGLDPHDTDERINDIALRCHLTALIVDKLGSLDRFGVSAREGLRFVISLADEEIPDIGHGLYGLKSLIDQNSSASDLGGTVTVGADDPALIIFTSGTTGSPKGIRYTHRQVCLAAASILEAFPELHGGSRLACWLPLSNLFQRMINFCSIARGAQIYYVENPQEIMRHVAEIEPHVFIGVPRFYEKLYAGIVERINHASAPKKHLANWAIAQGANYAAAIRGGSAPTIWQRFLRRVADSLVLKQIRRSMGQNLQFLISGSAPMPIWLLEQFQGMGFLVLEAYGMSENIIPIAANRPRAYRFGTVGLPMPGSEVRLAADGELMVRGPGVFAGYFNETAEESPQDANGFVASGDFATIDADGFVKLVGRKSEIFKTSTGRRISPTAIETLLTRIPGVEHAVVFGAGHPFLIAILVVSPTVRQASATNAAKWSECDQFRAEARRCLADMPDYQRPAGFLVTARPFTIDGGELTPNLKLRRHAIHTLYDDHLSELFQRLQSTPGARFETLCDDGQTVLCSA